MLELGLTDHVEAAADASAAAVYADSADLVRAADELGVRYAWFAEHHAHVHRGHLPSPLLLALHLAGSTRQISLGTAVICLNLHPALATAEQVATADHLTGGRLAPGFGSGSSPAEAEWLGGVMLADEAERHRRFEAALGTVAAAWQGEGAYAAFLPKASPSLHRRTWIAVNSSGAAAVAGRFGGNVLLSHLRTLDQHRTYVAAYRAAGGTGKVAMNRPVYVGRDDRTAWADAEPALRTLWRRFRAEGKIPADTPEPADPRALCGHPIHFIVGGPETVAGRLAELHAACPFDVLNAELRWDGLSARQQHDSLHGLVEAVRLVRAG